MKAYKDNLTGFVFTLPESLDELTFDQYLRITTIKEREPRRILEQLVDNVDELRKCNHSVVTSLYEKVRFLDDTTSILIAPLPRRIGGIKTTRLLMSVNKTTLRQYESVERWIEQLIREGAEDNFFTWLRPIMSIYVGATLLGRPFVDLAPVHTDEGEELRKRDLVAWSRWSQNQEEAGVDLTLVEPFVESVLNLSCTQAVPVACALLQKFSQPDKTGAVIVTSTSDSPMSVRQRKAQGWITRRRYQLKKLLATWL